MATYQYDDHDTVASLAERWGTSRRQIRALIRRGVLNTFGGGSGPNVRITYTSVLWEEARRERDNADGIPA